MPPTDPGVTALRTSHRFALTTVAADDREYCDRLQNSLVRGSHELLHWGVGPQLSRGDIVALYTPASRFLPDSEHSRIRRLYFAAADSTDGHHWNQHVLLHRRITLSHPITFATLQERVGISFRQIAGAGRLAAPLSEEVTTRLLTEVARSDPDAFARLRTLARDAKQDPALCISYSGVEWTAAQRVKLWLDEAGLNPFFISSVGPVTDDDITPLTTLLAGTFARASVVVCLIPPRKTLSPWVRLEIRSAMASAERVLFVRIGHRHPWPKLPRSRKARRLTIPQAEERLLVNIIEEELRAVRRIPRP